MNIDSMNSKEYSHFNSGVAIVFIPVPQYNYTIGNMLSPPLLTRTINGNEMTTKHALERQLEIIKYMNKSKL
jgi:hypothetical protein